MLYLQHTTFNSAYYALHESLNHTQAKSHTTTLQSKLNFTIKSINFQVLNFSPSRLRFYKSVFQHFNFAKQPLNMIKIINSSKNHEIFHYLSSKDILQEILNFNHLGNFSMENKTLLILNQVNSQTLKQKHDFSSTQHKYSNLSKALSASKKNSFSMAYITTKSSNTKEH